MITIPLSIFLIIIAVVIIATTIITLIDDDFPWAILVAAFLIVIAMGIGVGRLVG